MEVIKYTIPGVPMAWARAGRGTRGQIYDTQQHQKNMYRISIQSQHEGPMLSGPLELAATFVFPLPISRKRHWDKLRGEFHTFAPDASNLVKFLEDCLTGVVIQDDRIIARISVSKVYGDEPKTVFTLIPLSLGN